ncbi:MAG: polysaccharide deacetylase family protein, partial [Nostoc sp.]|uniref:polysaccharide deacetylase family protein n=1 Tax=Nostoc sp. TaxID=1180 RepID=UPI002FF7E488
MVGENVKNFPNLLKQEIAEGHVIGNHTWHHWYQFLNPQAAAYEIDHTEDIIFKTTGLKTNLFRPPGGVRVIQEINDPKCWDTGEIISMRSVLCFQNLLS